MSAKPYQTTDDLVEAVKLNISLPISQNTFSEDDIISFLNKELMISQVPSVMEFHEGFFVHTVTVPLRSNVSRYQIPNRAIGMKINDVTYQDASGNTMELTRINDGDKTYFQSNTGSNAMGRMFYLKGSYVVLAAEMGTDPTGSLLFDIFLRPNQLVSNDRAATISSFNKKITIVNASVVSGDTVTIFDQILTAGTDFTIGATSTITATNLANAINTNGVVTSGVSSAVVELMFENRNDPLDELTVSNSTGFVISDNYTIEFESVPENITNGIKVDFLQTNPGHQIYDFDITLASNAITGTSIDFDEDDIPDDLEVGDYICCAHESIIPNLPPELHNVLVERTSAKILGSMGDQQGLAASKQTIAEMERSQGTLIDNRVENSPKKILNRFSPLRMGKYGRYRKF